MSDWKYYEDDDEPDRTCVECHGEGRVMVCWDDMCVGLGDCMHGDGWAVCRACGGSGFISGALP